MDRRMARDRPSPYGESGRLLPAPRGTGPRATVDEAASRLIRSGAGAPELQAPLGPNESEKTWEPNHPLIVLIL